jgi:hypothetical protein
MLNTNQLITEKGRNVNVNDNSQAMDRFKVMTVVHITPQIMRAKNDG